VLGGWQANGIVTLESGRPFTVVSGRDNSASAVNADRADLVGDPTLDPGRPRGDLVAEYFARAAFAPNAPGSFGNVGRNTLRGPGNATVDLGLVKNFAFTERHRLQVRGEFFNLFNRVNLGNPNANQSSQTFARITSAGPPRVVQLAVKYVF
jgi:hypothetical protein